MPDENGFPTADEIIYLKKQIKRLESLDENFQFQQVLGLDVTEQRKQRDDEIAKINLIIKAYEMRIK